jgi:hypothetical protein
VIKSRIRRWARHVASMRNKRNAQRVLVGKPEGKRLLRGPKRWWEVNLKIYLKYRMGELDLSWLAQDVN